MEPQTYRNVSTKSEMVTELRELAEGAEDIYAFQGPREFVPELADALEAAHDRGVLVLLLLADEDPEALTGQSYPATAVRQWNPQGPIVTSAMVDYVSGFVTDAQFDDYDGDGRALAYHDRYFGGMHLTSLILNYWREGREVFTADPKPLPREYESFYHAVIDTAKHLRNDRDLYARVCGRRKRDDEPETITGPVVNVRQNIIYPITNSMPSENSLFLETDDGQLSIGGPSSELEDLRAEDVELFTSTVGGGSGSEPLYDTRV
jgi:hypothetical protein